jgi:hypothetical protein
MTLRRPGILILLTLIIAPMIYSAATVSDDVQWSASISADVVTVDVDTRGLRPSQRVESAVCVVVADDKVYELTLTSCPIRPGKKSTTETFRLPVTPKTFQAKTLRVTLSNERVLPAPHERHM